METTNNNMQELEQMRQLMNLLKEKLDKQDIVNNRLMAQSMKRKMSWINRYRWIALLCIPLVALCFLPVTLDLGLSWWLYGFTVTFVSVDAILDWVVNRTTDQDFMRGNLMETARRLTWMKKFRSRQLLVGCIVIPLWLAWLGYEIYMAGHNAPEDSELLGTAWASLVGMGIGGVIGGVAGLSIYFKMQRTNDEILAQIEEMNDME